MTTYATKNPLGSVDPRDLYDNSQNFDSAINDLNSTFWQDRFGRKRKTWYGIEEMAASAISSFGYITLDSFQSGATIELYNQVLRDTSTGEYYRWDGALPPGGKVVPAGSTPISTGGIGLGAWVSVGDASLRSLFAGKDGKGLDDFYGGGGWTGSNAGSENLQGRLHTNAMRWRFDIKDSDSLDPIIWIEKETVAMKGDTSTGDSGWDGGAGYWAVKKKAGDAGLNVITGYARHNGGSGDMIGVQGRGSGQHTNAAVWGMWAYAEVGFGAASTGVRQAIALESNTCNRGPDNGWMVGSGAGSARGVLSITADGTNRCTHAFYIGNHKASGGSPGTGGWWTGFLVGANSIAANTNSDTTYVGDGEAFRINGSGQRIHAYGGIRFYTGSLCYGVSFKESSFINKAAILMGAGQRINWGDHVGSSRWMGFDTTLNCINFNAMGIAVVGNKVVGERVTGVFNLSGTADGSSKNTETMTLPELARYVKKLSDSVIKHGLIGPT